MKDSYEKQSTRKTTSFFNGGYLFYILFPGIPSPLLLLILSVHQSRVFTLVARADLAQRGLDPYIIEKG